MAMKEAVLMLRYGTVKPDRRPMTFMALSRIAKMIRLPSGQVSYICRKALDE